MTVMKYNLDIVTFSSSHGGSPFYDSLMVGVRVNSLLSTPHELSQTEVGLPCLLLSMPLYLSAMTPQVQVLPGFPYITPLCTEHVEIFIIGLISLEGHYFLSR